MLIAWFLAIWPLLGPTAHNGIRETWHAGPCTSIVPPLQNTHKAPSDTRQRKAEHFHLVIAPLLFWVDDTWHHDKRQCKEAIYEKIVEKSWLVLEKITEKVTFCTSKSVKKFFTPLDRKCSVYEISSDSFDQFFSYCTQKINDNC